MLSQDASQWKQPQLSVSCEIRMESQLYSAVECAAEP